MQIHLQLYLILNFLSIDQQIFTMEWVFQFDVIIVLHFGPLIGNNVNRTHLHANREIRDLTATDVVSSAEVYFLGEVVFVEHPSLI
jgi:hypothetical protein